MTAIDTSEKNGMEQKRTKVTTVSKWLCENQEENSESDVDDLNYALDNSLDRDLHFRCLQSD